MPIIVDCARAYVTMGEMCDALRARLGHLARDARLLGCDGTSGGDVSGLNAMRLARLTTLLAVIVGAASLAVASTSAAPQTKPGLRYFSGCGDFLATSSRRP